MIWPSLSTTTNLPRKNVTKIQIFFFSLLFTSNTPNLPRKNVTKIQIFFQSPFHFYYSKSAPKKCNKNSDFFLFQSPFHFYYSKSAPKKCNKNSDFFFFSLLFTSTTQNLPRKNVTKIQYFLVLLSLPLLQIRPEKM